MHTPFFLFLEGIGGGEMMIIVVVILVFFGANKIPELARGLGKGIREFKDASREIRSEFDNIGQQPTQQPYQQPQPHSYSQQPQHPYDPNYGAPTPPPAAPNNAYAQPEPMHTSPGTEYVPPVGTHTPDQHPAPAERPRLDQMS